MDGDEQIRQLKELLNGGDLKDLKRALEMVIRKLDATELALERKIEKNFDEQNKLIHTFLGRPKSPVNESPEEPKFYS